MDHGAGGQRGWNSTASAMAVQSHGAIAQPPSHLVGEFIAMMPFEFAKFASLHLLTTPSPLLLQMDHGTEAYYGKSIYAYPIITCTIQ